MTSTEIRKVIAARLGASIRLGFSGVWFFREGDPEHAGAPWSPSWLLIGRDGDTDDPLFVDLGDPEHPVFTAAVGEDEWVPEQITRSLYAYIRIMEEIRGITAGRETPHSLDEKPITKEEQERIASAIENIDPTANESYWDSWLVQE